MLLAPRPPATEPASAAGRFVARLSRLESVAALAACMVVSVLISRRLLRPDVVSDDALVHQYWMWHYRNAALFNDPLTAELRGSQRYPDGYELLFRLATHFFDPIAFGEWVGVGLMALSGWLIFLIVRDHTDWRPAAWIAAAVFLALINIHRFHGGFPRAFVHPVVLLTVLMSMRRHFLAAALVAAGGALFYPPASLLAVGVVAVSALDWSGRRPRLDRRRTEFAVLTGALALVAVLGPQLIDGGAPRVFTASEARAYPDFGARGPLHFFADSTLGYLRQNRSGFDLQGAGSVLVLAGLALLLVGRGNIRLLRREVIALPIVSLAAFGAAQAVLFKLYLPHRYTYPLVAFFAIVVGVTLRPTWSALWAGTRPRLSAFALLCAPIVVYVAGVWAFPLGPRRSIDGETLAVLAGGVVVAGAVAVLLTRARGWSPPAVGAAVTGLALLVALLGVPDRAARGSPCPSGPAARYLATLPKDAIIAGDPYDMKCVPFTARRAVVISTQLAPAYEVDYFLQGRERLFADLRAYYGPSVDAIVELRRRYGATHLWVRREAIEKEMTKRNGQRWHPWQDPYGRYVRTLLRSGEPAVLHLPAACRRWKLGSAEVYDIACIASWSARGGGTGSIAQQIAAAGRPRQAVRARPRDAVDVDPVVERGDHDVEPAVAVEVTDRRSRGNADAVPVAALVAQADVVQPPALG